MSAVPLPIPSHLVAAVEAVLRGEAAIVPKRMTAENGAKAAMIGEFKFRISREWEGEDTSFVASVPWTTIKEIWKAGVEHFDASSPYAAAPGEGEPEADDRPEWELRTGFREEDFA